MKRKLFALALCAILTLSGFVAYVPDATAADAGATAYTFGDPDAPVRDLALEAKQRKKAKKKPSYSREQEQREKFARRRSA